MLTHTFFSSANTSSQHTMILLFLSIKCTGLAIVPSTHNIGRLGLVTLKNLLHEIISPFLTLFVTHTSIFAVSLHWCNKEILSLPKVDKVTISYATTYSKGKEHKSSNVSVEKLKLWMKISDL